MTSLVKNLALAALAGLLVSAAIVVAVFLFADGADLSNVDAEGAGKLIGSMIALPMIFMALAGGLWFTKRMESAAPRSPLKMIFGAAVGVLLVAVGGFIAFPPNEASTQLNAERPFAKPGEIRDAFIRGAVRNCTKEQRAEPENKDVSDELINGFCTCHANTMAETITREEFQYLEKHRNASADTAKKQQESFERCAQIANEKAAKG